jgi:hypothetical protein
MMAGLFLEHLSKMSLALDKKILKIGLLVIIIFAIGIYPMAKESFRMSRQGPILVPEEQLVGTYSQLSQFPKGRVIVEDTLYNSGNNPLSFTHLHYLIPVYSGLEIVGLPYPYPRYFSLHPSNRESLFGRQFGEWKKEDVYRIMDHYNMRYAFVQTPEMIAFMSNFSKKRYDLGPFVFFETNIKPSYFKTEGKILQEDYKGESGSVVVELEKESYVAMKSPPYANWKANIDGRITKVEICEGLICTIVPPGNHTVEFKYGYLLSDYVAYLISLGTILYLIYRYRKTK